MKPRSQERMIKLGMRTSRIAQGLYTAALVLIGLSVVAFIVAAIVIVTG